jgi:hypothetical protein
MCILSTHMVRGDNYLKNVRIDRAPVFRLSEKSNQNQEVAMDSQAIAIRILLRRHVKGDPALRFL